MLSLDREISAPWLAFDVAGQYCLLGLLITLAVAKHLPQRKNVYLLNFLFTAFLATIPPSLLLYAGKEHGKESVNLCFGQSALMDGTAPMFVVAQVILVFDTWSELRSSCLHIPHHSRKPLVIYLLIVVPYITMAAWTIVSLAAAFHSQASRADGFVYCTTASHASSNVRNAVGWFVSIMGLLGAFFELWVCWMIYSYPAKAQKDPQTWRTTIQFAVRVLAYSLILFLVVTLSLLDVAFHSLPLKIFYEVMNSLNALFVFAVFGSQKNILRLWRFWKLKRIFAKKDKSEEYEPQPQGYPMLDWSAIPARKPAQYDGAEFA